MCLQMLCTVKWNDALFIDLNIQPAHMTFSFDLSVPKIVSCQFHMQEGYFHQISSFRDHTFRNYGPEQEGQAVSGRETDRRIAPLCK